VAWPEADRNWQLVPVGGEVSVVMTDGVRRTIKVNRAPVLTLWAAVVAERRRFTHDEALTLGRAVGGLNAYSKGVSLGLIHPAPAAVREQREKLQKGKTLTVALLGRAVPVMHTPDGLRALRKDKPDDPTAVTRYLEGKFGDALPVVRAAMDQLARSLTGFAVTSGVPSVGAMALCPGPSCAARGRT
jgi:hypothetical protein